MKAVCFGAVEFVRRRWVTKVRNVGHWTYWAGVRDGDGSGDGEDGIHHVMISQRYFFLLIRRGAKRRRDCQRHPGIGPKAPTKVVQL